MNETTLVKGISAIGSMDGPVSYTHLDVYKRQSFFFLEEQKCIKMSGALRTARL